MLKLVACLALVASVPLVGRAASDPPAAPLLAPRLRPYDSRAAMLVQQGLERSATFASLAARVEASDVIVYIEMQPALPARLAGSLTWMAASSIARYVRVSLNPSLSTDLLTATLGHELQHALEVAGEPSIVDARSLQNHYERHGISVAFHANGWDTHAARAAGEDVRRDLAGTQARQGAESTPPRDEAAWQVAYRRARGMLPP